MNLCYLLFCYLILFLFNTLNCYALFPPSISRFEKYFTCGYKEISTEDSIILQTESCRREFYNFMSNRWDNRSTPSFDSTYNFMELHVDRKKRNGYLVQYCMLEASKLILVSLSKIRKGKLTGESIFFDLSNNLEAVVDYLNGNRHGRFIRYDTNNDNKKYISLYMEYRKDRLNGTAIRVGKNNDTLYHRIYRRGKVVKRINEKYPNMYAD